MEQASQALLTALRPAFRQVAYELAQQAAHEVAAQLPGKEVDVVLEDGEPVLRVRYAATGEVLDPEDLDARITLRVPADLKEAVESAASSSVIRSTRSSCGPSPLPSGKPNSRPVRDGR